MTTFDVPVTTKVVPAVVAENQVRTFVVAVTRFQPRMRMFAPATDETTVCAPEVAKLIIARLMVSAVVPATGVFTSFWVRMTPMLFVPAGRAVEMSAWTLEAVVITTVDPETLDVPVTVKVVPATGSTWILDAVEKIAVELPWIVMAPVDLILTTDTEDTIAVEFPEIVTAPVTSCSPDELTCAPTVES